MQVISDELTNNLVTKKKKAIRIIIIVVIATILLTTIPCFFVNYNSHNWAIVLNIILNFSMFVVIINLLKEIIVPIKHKLFLIDNLAQSEKYEVKGTIESITKTTIKKYIEGYEIKIKETGKFYYLIGENVFDINQEVELLCSLNFIIYYEA